MVSNARPCRHPSLPQTANLTLSVVWQSHVHVWHWIRIQCMLHFAHTLNGLGQFVLYIQKEHVEVLRQLRHQPCTDTHTHMLKFQAHKPVRVRKFYKKTAILWRVGDCFFIALCLYICAAQTILITVTYSSIDCAIQNRALCRSGGLSRVLHHQRTLKHGIYSQNLANHKTNWKQNSRSKL